MAGKRILDAFALLQASRNIAVKHFAIRFSQVELYSQTSSVAKALRFNLGSTSVPVTQNFSQLSSSSYTASQNTPIPSVDSIKPSESSHSQEEGIKQDHFYGSSEENSAIDAVPDKSINVKQAKPDRRPLPDGTIPPIDSPIGRNQGHSETFNQRPVTESPPNPLPESQASTLSATSSDESSIITPQHKPLSPHEAKVAQRKSEDPIPSVSAVPPGADSSDDSDFAIEQEKDVYYQPPGESKPVLSALPRVRVPKSENDVQSGDSHIPKDINADVFYSGANKDASEPDEEELAKLFHSPRVAKLLKKKGSYAPGGVSSREFHTVTQMRRHEVDAETKDTEKLAAALADDLKAEAITPTPKGYQMRESRVPSSRIGRLFEYGSLATSMAYGAVSESMTRSGGANGSLMLSPANMERLVAKLSKMRGAALKLGQMISFQDVKMLPKPIVEVLQRVQDSADYMPASQRNSVIAADLGSNWRDLFQSFEEKPMAAASIGQVHGATLKSGQRVAVKVQYPGVAASISSDLNNLSLLLKASRLLPKGLYLDKTIANARTELAWECDYIREAEAAIKFRDLLSDEMNNFTVPAIMKEASGKQVLTMERMEGIAVTKIQNFTQEQRDWIGTQLLRLCLREIIEFKYMQTDPNWTNFLYNDKTKKLELLDFGASRDFPEKFINLYVRVLEAASRKDRTACRDLSVELGYLTGYESKAMLNAHVDSVMTLAEPFMNFAPDVYDFQDQTITERVRAFIPVMLRERLAPPPEETYSLHRKLSGAFLLCARLGSRVRCKEMFQDAVKRASFI